MLAEEEVGGQDVGEFFWDCCEHDVEARTFLERLLPSGYSYNVEKLKIDESNDIRSETKFLAKFSVNVCKEPEKEIFLTELMGKTETSFKSSRKEKTIEPKGGTSYKSNRYNCCRKVRKNPSKSDVKEKQAGKNTDCPAFFSYKFFNCEKVHVGNEACPNLVMILSSEHNHSISSTDSWNFLKVSKDTERRYIELFEAGYTPSKARLAYIKELKSKLGEAGYFEVASKRSVNPDSTSVFNMWTKYCRRFGSVNGPDSFLKDKFFKIMFHLFLIFVGKNQKLL